MTRIAGILGAGAERHAATLERDLAAGRRVSAPPIQWVAPRADALIAALSSAPAAVVQREGLVVAIDGQIIIGDSPSSPTGVIQLIRRLGFARALADMRGEYAVAAYDVSERTLWLARDRLGVRPLYYTFGSGTFAFASRPRPLLPFCARGVRPNRRWTAVFAAGHYRYIDNVPEESPYEDILQLPGGHWLAADATGLRVGKYWDLLDLPEWTEPEHELADGYRSLLLESVQTRFGHATRPAFTLSGGMDSSSILGSAALRGGPQVAFSAVYTDRTFDESAEIQPMLHHAVSRWHAVPVDDPDVFSLVRQMVEANDEPVATATWLSHFRLCAAAASEGFGALFGGLGGDELNAGEYEYFFFHFADLAQQQRREDLEREIAAWASHHDHPIYRKNAQVAADTVAECTDPLHPGRCLPNVRRMRRYYATLRRDWFDLDAFEPVMETPFSSYLKNRTFQDLTRETAPCCLRAEDRQTEAFGLDNHVPFFDHRLVEFMFRVPGSLKIRNGVTKILLREATRGVVAEETRTRIKKTGWNAPAHLWFSGRGREQLLDLIHSRRFRERGIYDVPEVLRLAEEHEAIVRGGEPRENHMMFFWQLVNLETWLAALDERVTTTA